MSETWLQPNRRALAMGMLPALAFAVLGFCLLWLTENSTTNWRTWIGIFLMLLGIVVFLALVIECNRPRIGYAAGHVWFRLRSGKPIAVPVEIVEAFFLGQGPADLPVVRGQRAETVNLIARLSQRAPEWFHVDVHPSLGHWCDGYVTIRGTWCEPLTVEVIHRLNHRLHDVTSDIRADAKATAQT